MLEGETLSNNIVYQSMLNEGKRRDYLDVACEASKMTLEEEQTTQQFQKQVVLILPF